MNNNSNNLSSGRKYTKNEICKMLIADCDLNKKRKPNVYNRSVSNQNVNSNDDLHRSPDAERKEQELYESYRLEQERSESLEREQRLDEIHSKYGYHCDVYNDGNLDEMERKARNDDYMMWY